MRSTNALDPGDDDPTPPPEDPDCGGGDGCGRR